MWGVPPARPRLLVVLGGGIFQIDSLQSGHGEEGACACPPSSVLTQTWALLGMEFAKAELRNRTWDTQGWSLSAAHFHFLI